MEKGFFHPLLGYWQTTGDPAADIRATYPVGTVAVPVKPGADMNWDGSAWVAAPVAAPTVDDYRRAIDAHVEETARAWGYNSAAHIAGYAASTVTQWAAEATAFIAWRDAMWLAAIAKLAAIQAGQQPAPASVSALIATLPAAVRPTAN